MEQDTAPRVLPENAYKELKEGEVYHPVMDPAADVPEVTPYSVLMGLAMAILFSAAAAYSGLKIGQVMEAAIPIAILAVGVSALTRRKGALGQNVIIQSIGSTSGAVVAGAIFTIPALYILDLPTSFFRLFLAATFGAFLGILFLIPLRKYFVKDMHGKLPFPEATATTEILMAGERGGKQAIVLIVSGLIGGFYDFIVSSLGWWSEVVTSRVVGLGASVAEKVRVVFRLDILSIVVGLGYIVGLKYSCHHLCRVVPVVVRLHSYVLLHRRSSWCPSRSNGDKADLQHERRGNFPDIRPAYRNRRNCDGGNHRRHPIIEDHWRSIWPCLSRDFPGQTWGGID